MAQILTFLGKGGTGRTTLAIAAAKAYASQGRRVLLLGHGAEPSLSLMLGVPLNGGEVQAIAPNLQVLQVRTSQLLEQGWDQVKQLEAQYLRTPFFKNVFGQELAVLPGMDYALVLNLLRELDASGQYDVILLDSSGDMTFLRTLGMPEMLNWYARRFRQVFAESDLGKTLSPFIQPVSAAVLNVNFTSFDNPPQPVQQAENLLSQGQAAVADPQRFAAFLVTTPDPVAIATARYLWGNAQQVGVTVGGVLLNQASGAESVQTEFSPLPVSVIPAVQANDWSTLTASLPDFGQQAQQAPRAISIDSGERKVKLFLPGFDKSQVKLSQSGPEVTIEAGDQRRNIFLPPELRGQPVKGAKFQDGYLTISF